MMRNLLIVGAGGFIGSSLRYLSQILFEKIAGTSFPYGTLFVNIAGSFFIGILFALSEKGNYLTVEWRLFLAVGICGGFTTFSTFALDNVNLLNDQSTPFFLMNVFGSIALAIVAVYLGIISTRLIM